MTYTTKTLIEAELRASSAFSSTTTPTDTQVDAWIAETDAYINQLAGRTYASTAYVTYIDYEGQDRILLKHAPIITVTTVEYNAAALGSTADWSTKTADTDYSVYAQRGEILILPAWAPSHGEKRIRITYTAGYSSTPATVQMLATKLVAKRVVDTIMSQDMAERKSGKSVSVGSISIVKSSDFGVGQYTQLGNEIKELETKLVSGSGVYRYE